MSETHPIDDVLWHQSGVNQKGEPFVQLIRGTAVIAQMSVQQAREHGNAIIEAAEAAEQDAFLFDWVINKVGQTTREASVLLQEFRAYRAERTGKRGGPSDPKDWVMPTK